MDTDTPTTVPEPGSHESAARSANILSRKSTCGEVEYLLENLVYEDSSMFCTCLENILSGPENPCLKRRIAKLRGLHYEPERQSGKCTCGEAWKSVGEFEDYFLLGETGDDANSDSEETIETYRAGGDFDASFAFDLSKATDCEDHGGWAGNLKRLCDKCREEHGSPVVYCEEHGGWAGNLKRLCDACKEVYGDPYQCSDDDCQIVDHGGIRGDHEHVDQTAAMTFELEGLALQVLDWPEHIDALQDSGEPYALIG